MDSEPISDDIRRFILTSIPSVPYLEALLLLRNAPEESWDSHRVAQRLYLSDKIAADLLDALRASHVAAADHTNGESASDIGYRYAPVSPQLRDMIDRLALTYSRHLVAVTHLIHSKTGRKAQHFADAFVLRKKS